MWMLDTRWTIPLLWIPIRRMTLLTRYALAAAFNLLTSPDLCQVDENYDPTEFFSGIGVIGGGDHNGQANGNGHGANPDPSDRLQDDLAVSDDSDDGGEEDEEGVDPMAF